MQPLCYIAFTVLCSLPFLPYGVSKQCNKTQYDWPVSQEAKFCCNMCPPGERMVRRSETSCEIECTSCTGQRYSDSYNVEMSCNICKTCKKSNMEYKSQCNATHDAVCRCKAGYRCKDQSCTQCVPMPDTATPTFPPSSRPNQEYRSRCNATHDAACRCKAGYRCKDQSCTHCVLILDTMTPTLLQSTTTSTPEAITTPLVSSKPIRDTVWFLVIIALLCVGIALAMVTKIKPFLRWLKSKDGFCLPMKPAPVSPCSEDEDEDEDEDVSKPVQEVCGKCDQPIDV